MFHFFIYSSNAHVCMKPQTMRCLRGLQTIGYIVIAYTYMWLVRDYADTVNARMPTPYGTLATHAQCLRMSIGSRLRRYGQCPHADTLRYPRNPHAMLSKIRWFGTRNTPIPAPRVSSPSGRGRERSMSTPTTPKRRMSGLAWPILTTKGMRALLRTKLTPQRGKRS